MSLTYSLATTLSFLQKIQKNNNREWFAKHKKEYDAAFQEMVQFADEVLFELRKTDHIETASGQKSAYRIYNDVRFSKDILPYKKHLDGSFKRATNVLRGSYYYHIEPGHSFIAGGFWGPNPQDLSHIRQQIAADCTPLTSLLSEASFKKTFGKLLGEQVKTAPRGFDMADPAIELLRYKQFIIRRNFTDKEVSNTAFHLEVAKTFKKMRPFLNYMSEILNTDLNGLSIV